MNSYARLPLLWCLTFCAALLSAQSTGIRLIANQPRQRELWFGHGRVIPGQAAAALRYRANRQKLELRALTAAAPRSVGLSALRVLLPATSGRGWGLRLWPLTQPDLGYRTTAWSRDALPLWPSIPLMAAAMLCISVGPMTACENLIMSGR